MRIFGRIRRQCPSATPRASDAVPATVSRQDEEPSPAISREQIVERLRRELRKGNLRSEPMQRLLTQLNATDREEIARATGTMVQYYGDEVRAVGEAEEQAALRAAPPGYSLEQLNGLNVGCGNRPVHPSLLNLDAHKGAWALGPDPKRQEAPIENSKPRHHSIASLRAWAHDLPFRSGSVDFIIALHLLEHLPDPVATVLHWLDIVKPGGGLGIVVPDWRYTWDARNDTHPWSHRWNPTPELVQELYQRHWSSIASLEALQSYRYKLSFDFVLRKHGVFEPFDTEAAAQFPTGHQLHQSGRFVHGSAA